MQNPKNSKVVGNQTSRRRRQRWRLEEVEEGKGKINDSNRGEFVLILPYISHDSFEMYTEMEYIHAML